MTLQPPQPSRHRTTDSEERNYQQIRVRQDTNTNWLKNNPIPASGEWCYSIGYRNPPTTYPLNDLPPATKELEGTFILVSDGDKNYVYECIATLKPSKAGGSGYLWRPRDIIYVEPQQPDQCVKIGDGNVRWSELPWLGGRGPQGIVGPEGPQGEKGWGVVYRTVETVSAEGQTIFRLMTTVEVETSMVTINGVILSPSNYTLTSDTLTLTNSIDTKAGDIVSVFSWIGAVESIIAGLNTADIETLSVRPSGVEAKPRSEIKNQQEVNWYLLDKVDDLEIPEASAPFDGDMKGERITNLGNAEGNNDAVSKAVCKGWDMYTLESANDYCDKEIKKIDIPSIDGLASQEWVLDQSYITEQVVTDAVSDQAQTQETIDSAQDTKITTLENKVDALEGTVVEAQFKADARDTPSLGCFILQTIGKEKTNLFSQASEIILSTTDFTNKPISAESILNGDLVRLVMSPTNYATYKVTGSYVRDDEITIEVEYGTSGSENFVFDGAVYDFTHTTPFDVGSAATKQYVDAQDEVTLNAANSYADQAIAGIDIPEVSTDGLMTTTGENICASQWKVRAPAQGGGNWTYISLAGTVGELALNHLRNPSERHHATNKGWVEDQAYVSTDSESPLVNQTITWNSSVSDTTPKMLFSSTEEYSPQSTEKMLLAGNYKSNGGSPSTWSFGYNTAGNYWNYDWAFGSNLTCRYVMGDQNKCVMSIDKNGVDMPSAYIVGDYSLEGVAEEDVEAVKAQAREIDIGHRLRELKNILVNLKTALKTKSADAQQALLDVLENVEDI